MPQEWQPASKERHFDASGYLSNRTIAALCTPTGGAICVLRVSGALAGAIAKRLTGKNLRPEDHRRAFRSWLCDSGGGRLDDAVVLPFFGPHSFTGEDTLELFLHGSPIVAQRVLDECFAAGARLALPGEFSFRAVKNGKMQLTQAEAVNELIGADNDFSLALALEKLSGTQHELVSRIRADLMQLCTLSEVGIDFSDQDVDEVSLPRLKERLSGILEALERLRGSFDRGARFVDGVPVAIFGLPNAGKSSFFNALLGEDRSIVSDVAGTTRDVVRERLSLKGRSGQVTLKVSDTAGLRKTGDQIEEIGIDRSLKAARDADLVVVVLDGLSPELAALKPYLAQIQADGKRRVWICTKRDRVDGAARAALDAQVKDEFGGEPLWVSSLNLEGIHEAAQALADGAGALLARHPGEVVLTRIEHVRAVEECLGSLRRAKDATDLVLFATDVRHGMNDLGPLIGETVPDDVLGKIFSDFCIGK
jgi:tRNA modification GTPase